MVSGHEYRAQRPNTWPLRKVKILFANPKPSTHGPRADMSRFANDGSGIALSYNPSAISAHFNMRSLLRNASTAGSSDAGAPAPTKAVAATMSQR